jgi:hypothetical protein
MRVPFQPIPRTRLIDWGPPAPQLVAMAGSTDRYGLMGAFLGSRISAGGRLYAHDGEDEQGGVETKADCNGGEEAGEAQIEPVDCDKPTAGADGSFGV